jgi:ATP-dependent helicase HrpB
MRPSRWSCRTPATDPLPVREALPALKAALAERASAVLVAPPGAGKTTLVPLELMAEPWAGDGKILVLEPRRLSARAAAERMASTLGERAGETVGYRVRLQAKVSARTRVEILTEGVFTRMILDDPGLEGVAGVLFDEFHERSLDADLGLALALDAQQLLRPDLRLLVMSATLDGARVAGVLGEAPVIESHGRQFPIETRYLGRDPAASLEDQVVRAVQKALAEEGGSLLVFLPGQGEIRRVEQRLAERIRDPAVDLALLYGALDFREQERAIAPAPGGRRKVVLATSIAETSLTIQGVRVVVDCGLARVPRYDPSSGLTRLETQRVSRAAADQRRGRAGRTEPGVCYRLWDEAETRALIAFARPEMLEADLSGLALDLARWGAKDASSLRFLDPPPATAFAEARALLARLQALDGAGDLTRHGRALAELPLPPRLAHMLLKGAASGAAGRAAAIAAVLTERGLGGTAADLHHRLEAFARDRSPRASDARALAGRWARLVARSSPSGGSPREAGEGGSSPRTSLYEPPSRLSGGLPPEGEDLAEALLLAEAYPERVAKARGKPGEFLLASGRGAFVDPADSLAREPWLAVAELGGGASRDRILLAAPLDEALLREAFADRIVAEEVVDADASGRLRARRRLRLDALVIEDRPIERPPAALMRRHLLAQAAARGLDALPWSEPSRSLRERAAFMRGIEPEAWPDLSDEALIASAEAWLAPLLEGCSSLAAIDPHALAEALKDLIGRDLVRRLEREAPPRWTAPTGSQLEIDYAAEGGPRVEARVQELFGLAQHPAVANGRAPLTLALLSPAHRPIQITRDLPGFWRGSWKAVRTEMKGRYPKHVWPEDPMAATPTTRAKPRGT